MKAAAGVAVAGVLALAAGCGGTAEPAPAPPRTVVQFGFVKSLEPKGEGYEMAFDPAWLLSGESASRAAAEDGVVQPGEPVPNDYYVVDEGHRLLTYLVPSDARISVLRDGVEGTEIAADDFAALVRGEQPFAKPLVEPITTGFWAEIQNDAVRSLTQQYFP